MTWKIDINELRYPKVKSKIVAYVDFLGVIFCPLERAVERR